MTAVATVTMPAVRTVTAMRMAAVCAVRAMPLGARAVTR
jgi:hypothetical protein